MDVVLETDKESRGFLGGGGQTKVGGCEVGVWHSCSSLDHVSTTSARWLKVLTVGTVRMGMIGRNSSRISRPMCWPQREEEFGKLSVMIVVANLCNYYGLVFEWENISLFVCWREGVEREMERVMMGGA